MSDQNLNKTQNVSFDLGELGKVVIEEIELFDVEVLGQMIDGGSSGGIGGISGYQTPTFSILP